MNNTAPHKEVGPLSQAAVASFVFSVAQLIVLPFYYILLFTLKSGTALLSAWGMSDPLIVSGPLVFIVGNLFGLLGLVTGLTAVESTRNGKSGDGLGTFGILLSLTIIGTSAFFYFTA